MGPNGAGKTTLGFALMGHPRYEVTEGTVMLGDQNLLEMEVSDRAKAGLFLAFQYPFEVSGVTVANFLRQAVNAVRGRGDLGLGLPGDARREDGAAGDGRVLRRPLPERGLLRRREEAERDAADDPAEPKIAILDETDSGLDIDALKVVAKAVNSLRGPDFGAIVITHYHRILDHIKPDVVHVLMNGRIVKTGGPELALEIEKKGYDWIKAELGIVDEAAEAGVK